MNRRVATWASPRDQPGTPVPRGTQRLRPPFATGDLAVHDAEGYVAYCGRIKEMVKTSGINVSPAEVEEVLLKHPRVSEACVLGLSDPTPGRGACRCDRYRVLNLGISAALVVGLTSVVDIATEAVRARVTAIYLLFSGLSGMGLAPALMGYANDALSSFGWATLDGAGKAWSAASAGSASVRVEGCSWAGRSDMAFLSVGFNRKRRRGPARAPAAGWPAAVRR